LYGVMIAGVIGYLLLKPSKTNPKLFSINDMAPIGDILLESRT